MTNLEFTGPNNYVHIPATQLFPNICCNLIYICIRKRFFSKSITRHIHTTGISFKQLTELASISGRWGETLSANAASNSTNKKQDNALCLCLWHTAPFMNTSNHFYVS